MSKLLEALEAARKMHEQLNYCLYVLRMEEGTPGEAKASDDLLLAEEELRVAQKRVTEAFGAPDKSGATREPQDGPTC